MLPRGHASTFAAFWPNQGDNPVTKGYDKATKYVVTRRSDHLDWKKSQRISGDVVDEVRRLKSPKGPELHIWGSHQLLQTLIAADLVKEYRLWISP